MAFRDNPFDNLKVPVTVTAVAVTIAAGVVAALLLLADRRDNLGREPIGSRSFFDAAAGHTNGVVAAPLRWIAHGGDEVQDYFFAVSENRRLHKQVAELQKIRDAYLVQQSLLKRYEQLLKLRTEPPVPFVTGHSVSESRGPFSNARLIDVGADQGVAIGNPAINDHGLLGRVVGTTTGVSRVLMLTDVASRTPVLVYRSDARAILVGDGGPNPRLEFLRGKDSIQEGDQILTSGDGGMFPRGLPVGVAAKGLDGGWRVKLYSDRGPIDLVRVMLFKDFSALADKSALDAPPLAALVPVKPTVGTEAAAGSQAPTQTKAQIQAQAGAGSAGQAGSAPANQAPKGRARSGSETVPQARPVLAPGIKPITKAKPQSQGAAQ